MNATGKAARKRYGTRAAAKQRREAGTRRKRNRKRFGELPVSEKKGNAKPWREGMPESFEERESAAAHEERALAAAAEFTR